MRTVEEWKTTLRTGIKDAMRARDAERTALFRTLLAALDNAEAPPLSASPASSSSAPEENAGRIAGAANGLGAGDIARRDLSPEDAQDIVVKERDERLAAAETFLLHHRETEAADLRRQADIIATLLLG